MSAMVTAQGHSIDNMNHMATMVATYVNSIDHINNQLSDYKYGIR